jgi:hypothetical protein
MTSDIRFLVDLERKVQYLLDVITMILQGQINDCS